MRRHLLLLVALLLTACANHVPIEPSQALPAKDSPLGAALIAQAQQHPGGQSGFRLLSSSTEAFIARAELIRAARQSLDLQYYIVHDGLSTRALIDELLKAADRGVRVRILLDDTTSDGQDDEIALLGAHPNVQVRVFNPLHLGRATGITRALGRLFDVTLQHRRMHNKLWLADNAVAVVGGRNLGDEYFDVEPNLNFTDIDLLGAGPVAEQLGQSFDQYWNSALSKPIEQFVSFPPSARDLAKTRRGLTDYLNAAQVEQRENYQRLMDYQDHPRLAGWLDELIWAHGSAMWDAPTKILKSEPDPQLLLTSQLGPELASVSEELMLISAYFVPAEDGLTYLTGRADAGVSVSLLTNSLEATDVPAVHGGYAPYRKALLRHGVKLFELRRQPEQEASYNLSGSSESSLHSKALVFDRRKVFIGSLNFDPRSILWNTEVGVLVDSPELAGEVRRLTLEGMAPALSYEVRLENGRLVWIAEDNRRLHRIDREPGGAWRQINAWLAKVIGLERLL
ncbi:MULTISPECIES: phospholipase D family protein [Pseudomonas]|uniref:phospholipase D family protein n=1 Tax=Pseudomonas TaxID=286 RepID=UPI00257A8EBB|nr:MULTISPECIES: phospholipase D family protein [Pseudomonas]